MITLPEYETLIVDQQASRLYVTINRPEARNALSDAVVAELDHLCDALQGDRGIRTVILRGAGGTFCAGGDLKAFQQYLTAPAPGDGSPDPIAIKNRRFGDFLIKLNAIPQVLVGVIEGAAFGGGLGLVCVTDIALCEAGTKFALSETGLGIPPAQIAPFVVQRLGLTAARRIALSGARFTGIEARDLGLVHFVAEDRDGLEARLTTVLNDIGRCAPGANAETKRILLESLSGPLDRVLDDAAVAFAAQLRGPEGQEGVAAFLGKRAANWVEQLE